MSTDLNFSNEATPPIKLLNALFPEFYGWDVTRAGKAHVDRFNDPILRGEDHYTRRFGRGQDEIRRISYRSMTLMVDSIFDGNAGLLIIAARTIESRRNATLEAFKNIDR